MEGVGGVDRPVPGGAVGTVDIQGVTLVLRVRVIGLEHERGRIVDVVDTAGDLFDHRVGIASAQGDLLPEVAGVVGLHPLGGGALGVDENPVLIGLREGVDATLPVSVPRSEIGSLFVIAFQAQARAAGEGLLEAERPLLRQLRRIVLATPIQGGHVLDGMHLSVIAPTQAQATARGDLEQGVGSRTQIAVAGVGGAIVAQPELEGEWVDCTIAVGQMGAERDAALTGRGTRANGVVTVRVGGRIVGILADETVEGVVGVQPPEVEAVFEERPGGMLVEPILLEPEDGEIATASEVVLRVDDIHVALVAVPVLGDDAGRGHGRHRQPGRQVGYQGQPDVRVAVPVLGRFRRLDGVLKPRCRLRVEFVPVTGVEDVEGQAMPRIDFVRHLRKDVVVGRGGQVVLIHDVEDEVQVSPAG